LSARTALVIEDDKGIQQLLRDALEAEGFQVLVEKDGEWALKALERRLPDVVISDVLLPSVSGFELIEALRAMPGGDQVPVIVISGIYKGKRHKRQATEELGVVAYLDKPFEVSALLDAVRTALGEDYPGAQKARPKRRPAASSSRAASDPLADKGAIDETQEVESAAVALAAGRTARGNLKHKPFAEVLSQLYRWRATGALLLRHERVKKIVYLKEGYPIFVKSNLLSECLGRVLVREKIITEAECEASLENMKGGQRQQGTVLIEMGCISPHNLVYGLQMQLELKLFEIFGWEEGDYQFSTKIDIPAQAVHLDMSLATIIYEGVRRTHSKKHLEDRLAPFLDSYFGVHEDPLHRFQEISLEADERRLVAMIDGRRTARDLIARSELDDVTTLQLLYALLAAEMIQPHTKRAKRKDTLIPQPAAASAADKPPPLKKRKGKAKAKNVAGGEAEPQLNPTTMDAFDVPVEELRKRLTMRVKAMRRQNHFEVLGVSKSASTDEIKRAYYAQMRDVHPDRMRLVVPADARHLAEQIAQQLTRAFEAIGEEERRSDYVRDITGSAKTGVSDEVGRILQAETHFRKGTQAIEKEAWGDAEEALLQAIDLYPEEGEFFSHLGWVQAKVAARFSGKGKAKRLEEAEERIREGIQKNPRSDKGYLFLGYVLKDLGRPDEAVEQFEAAIQCNPDCTEALQELKLLSD
jgi:DNA-binding response OmpR family regulator/curved DNA-binding protein CbpA